MQLAASVGRQKPPEVAFWSPTNPNVQAAVDRLVQRGVSEIAAVMWILSLSLFLASLIGNADQELRELVKKRGAVEILIIKEYSPVDLPELTGTAGTIARVLVSGSRAELVGEKVWTDYTMQVLSVIKGSPKLEGTTITVRKPGGTVALEGGTVMSRDPDFPAFDLAEEYVLFLSQTGDGRYVIVYGAQGAFRVAEGRVSQVSTDTGTWNRERGPVGLSEFLTEVAAAARQK